jgi:aryl-alcohol dehydrogenase-like predicted oxidoreductase
MDYRRLGRTGLWCSHLGLGGHHRGGDQEMRNRVVAKALDLGINYFDTTSNGEAKELGESLEVCKGRDRAYIVRDFLKARDPELRQSPEAEYKRVVREHLEEGLEMLRTDYVDVFRMTPPEGNPQGEPVRTGIMPLGWPMEEFHNVHWFAEEFEKLRGEGKCRYMGLSTHNPPFQEKAVREVPQLDLVYLPYNYVFSGADDKLYPTAKGEGTLFEECTKRDRGIVTIKPFMKRAMFQTEAFQKRYEEKKQEVETVAAFALRFVLANPHITVAIPGMDDPEQVAQNVAAVKQGAPTKAELGTLDHYCRDVPKVLTAEYQWAHQWTV